MPQTITLNFPPGETEATFDVSISDDDINELPEFFYANMSNPSMGAVLGPDSVATVNIVDNDRELCACVCVHVGELRACVHV